MRTRYSREDNSNVFIPSSTSSPSLQLVSIPRSIAHVSLHLLP
jgi:hypothetical protein